MLSKKYFSILFSMLAVTGCPDGPVNPNPTPTSSPIVSVTPTPIVSAGPSDPVMGSFFRVDFGPGSKGVNSFGPGSKGVSNNFGPGSKGVSNLRFNVSIPENLVNTGLTSFNTKAGGSKLVLNQVKILLHRNNQIVATATVLPVSTQVTFALDMVIPEAELYNVTVRAENNFDPVSLGSIIRLENNLELKVSLYSRFSTEANRETLDIAIRTKPINPPAIN